MRLSIIVPTYNERENVKPLIERIGDTLGKGDYEILVVDDNSPDGTANVVQSLSEDHPVRVIRRPRKLGLASAIVEGIRRAEGDIVGVIDADLQHPPELMAQLVEAVTQGNDIAIASRYVPGGAVENWSLLRKVVSRGAILLARPLTKARDPMSGCFVLNREVVLGREFRPAGFKILLEILVRGKYERIKEVPYTFRERQRGRTKLGLAEYARYLRLLCSLYLVRLKGIFATGRAR